MAPGESRTVNPKGPFATSAQSFSLIKPAWTLSIKSCIRWAASEAIFPCFFREEVDEQGRTTEFWGQFSKSDEKPSNKKYHLANAQSKLSSKHLAWGIHLIVASCFLMALFIMFQATVKQWSATCQPNVLQPGFAKTSNMVPLKDRTQVSHEKKPLLCNPYIPG